MMAMYSVISFLTLDHTYTKFMVKPLGLTTKVKNPLSLTTSLKMQNILRGKDQASVTTNNSKHSKVRRFQTRQSTFGIRRKEAQ